ncbi:leishmanolysin homolog isoform X2 [Schistocerca gregaria]|uniref:leishmanolysin homolog isoform X2 n=1 Tax=Schistocerca gregaria TaxID=7010 RepID=UPI00211E1856|nr:leishmanolysin homolog isoform X2 [Schistocerca gregaria]
MASGHVCIHDTLRREHRERSWQDATTRSGEVSKQKYMDLGQSSDGNEEKEWMPLRILPLYLLAQEDLDSGLAKLWLSSNALTSQGLERRTEVVGVLNRALMYLSSLLNVKRDRINARVLERPIELESDVEGFANKSREANFIVIVTAMGISMKGVEAYSMMVDKGEIDGRPMLGWVNLNPDTLFVSEDGDFPRSDYIALTFLHEVTHLLGFNVQCFEEREIVGNYHRIGGGQPKQSVMYIKSKRVLKFVKDHFGCANLPGAFLEDNGEEGTFSSHWEKSMYLDEYMIGDAGPEARVTRLTIAALEDLGWYRYTGARLDALVWGAKAGCKMATTFGCSAWPASYSCSTLGVVRCAKTLGGYGPCVEDSNSYLIGEGCRYYKPFYSCSEGDRITETGPSETHSVCIESYIPSAKGSTGILTCRNAVCTSDRRVMIEYNKNYFSCESLNNQRLADVGYISCSEDRSALCSGQDIDVWPSLTDVNPKKAPPSTNVVITGSELSPDGRLDIGGPCQYVGPVGNGKLVFSLPNAEVWRKRLVRHRKFDVLYIDPYGRSDILAQAFEPMLNAGFLTRAQWWAEDNVITVIAVGAIIITFIVLVLKYYFN